MEILATWGDGVGFKEGGSSDIVHQYQVRVMLDQFFLKSKFWTKYDIFTDRWVIGRTYVDRSPLDEMFGTHFKRKKYRYLRGGYKK